MGGAQAPDEILELGSILAAATAFWSGVLGDVRLNDAVRALMVMTAAILTDLPGVVMLFAPRAICVMPGENAARFGLTPLQDQQIAGLLMWVPANLIFFAIATFLFARWIGAVKQRAA
jgi:putative membrane protein